MVRLDKQSSGTPFGKFYALSAIFSNPARGTKHRYKFPAYPDLPR